MLGIQMIGIVMCVFMAYITFVYMKQKKIDSRKGIVWMIIWIGAVIWLFLIDITRDIVLNITNVATIFELSLAIGVLFAVILSFLNNLKINRTEKNMEHVIRLMTLKEGLENDNIKNI